MKTITFSVFLAVFLVGGVACISGGGPNYGWNDPNEWTVERDGRSWLVLSGDILDDTHMLALHYRLVGPNGWVQIGRAFEDMPPVDHPILLNLKADGDGMLEIKLVDVNDSVYGARVPLTEHMNDWRPIVIYPDNTEYWWGGTGDEFAGLKHFQVAIAYQGEGTVWLNMQGVGQPGTPTTLPPGGSVLDPDRDLPGVGFRQRRDAELIPEDPLILEWMKGMQDASSPEQWLLPSMENNECHTFNNALVAMAFLVKGERERAERVLDFYANATDRDNESPTRQNFFYKGEARGFFQEMALRTEGNERAYHIRNERNDRWMGDMAWLMMAYKYHAEQYGPERYAEISGLLLDLLLNWYIEADDGPGGYIGHGWLEGDRRLHEDFGHHEGNIDAYAVMQLYGKTEVAENIRAWLDRAVDGRSLPLDLYTWRTLAYGPDYAYLLDIPEHDLRYRKVLEVNGKPVMGLYDHPNLRVTNSWLDGVGHIACAYFAAGKRERGNFYANQLDPFIIEREIDGRITHAIPYVANNQGYEWVNLDRGFVSVAAWYIFAKNRFNPMTLEHY